MKTLFKFIPLLFLNKLHVSKIAFISFTHILEKQRFCYIFNDVITSSLFTKKISCNSFPFHWLLAWLIFLCGHVLVLFVVTQKITKINEDLTVLNSHIVQFSQFSHAAMSNSLWLYGLQLSGLLCITNFLRVY